MPRVKQTNASIATQPEMLPGVEKRELTGQELAEYNEKYWSGRPERCLLTGLSKPVYVYEVPKEDTTKDTNKDGNQDMNTDATSPRPMEHDERETVEQDQQDSQHVDPDAETQPFEVDPPPVPMEMSVPRPWRKRMRGKGPDTSEGKVRKTIIRKGSLVDDEKDSEESQEF
jgi:hypothetical protein